MPYQISKFSSLLLLFSLVLMGSNKVAIAQVNSAFANNNYLRLSQALAYYQQTDTNNWPVVPAQPAVLKHGVQHHTVQLLRQRLQLMGDLASNQNLESDQFDSELEAAVKNFQARHGLKVDGVVGIKTRKELNISPQYRIEQLKTNIRRWQELSNALGDHFVMVNIPDFHLYLVYGDKEIFKTKAIVGKTELPTPELFSKITTIVLNPYWHIPDSIAKNDIIPKIIRNPNYLNEKNIKVFSMVHGRKIEIDPSSVDWSNTSRYGSNFIFQQEPGPDNSLGLIKFEFQNEQNVYLHDTPSKELFDANIRNFSHGCIRLEKPFELAWYLLQNNPEWNNYNFEQILASGETKFIRLKSPIPIVITYITAWVDSNGQLNFRDDIYQRDGQAEEIKTAELTDVTLFSSDISDQGV